jgi:uncharacterized membrane protein
MNTTTIRSNPSRLAMTHKSQSSNVDLIIISCLSAIALFFVILPGLSDTIIRSIVGFTFIAFVPGYSFISSLFPKNDIAVIERIALAFGFDVIVISLIGLVSTFAGIETSSDLTIGLIVLFSLVCTVLASINRKRTPAELRFTLGFNSFKL